MRGLKLFSTLWVAAILLCILPLRLYAQNGDQILDGIGETVMVARYVLNGNAKDWTRNNLHAALKGTDLKFVNDNRFGQVLSLNGNKNSFVELPPESLNNLESITISAWINLRSDSAGQLFFLFAKDAKNVFYSAPAGTQKHQGLVTKITSQLLSINAVAPALGLNRWYHLAIVVDVPARSLKTYVNNSLAGESKGITKELAEIFVAHNSGTRQVAIGKTLSPNSPGLNALIHDFRIYSIPLNASQIAGIFKNGQRSFNEGSVNVRKAEEELPKFPPGTPQLYNSLLASVSNINVETTTGTLPRLPATLKGIYKGGFKGPDVKVIWPSEIDIALVNQPGTYTITATVPGTQLRPQAFITVKNKHDNPAPNRLLSPFPLKNVSLNKNLDGKNTKLIKNRDKFINTLSQTDPNSFLYMFRHAFGQKQPEGAVPLGVWDSKETKLRGHATGHYLTAIAQAYASTAYNKELQDNFLQKMDYMVNTLYDLAQLSGNPKEPGGRFVSDVNAIPAGEGKKDFDSDISDEGIRNDYWNWGKGFISAYPPDQFIMLEHGAKYGGQKNQIWAPYYTLHKIMAGLLDVYDVSGNKKALHVASGMGDWVYQRLSKLQQDTLIKMWNTYIAGEYGGMNEVMARLYSITGDSNFFKTAQLFDNIKVFYGDKNHSSGLAKNVDLFRGLHANQHIPQIVGSIEMYNVSKQPDYYRIADNFWYKMVNDYMYSIGGVAGARNPSNAECFTSQPASLYENGFSAGGQNETCATYNLLKLTRQLFLFEPRAELMDYYERALYNHILASVAEHTPANTYHVPLNPGSVKQFGNPEMKGFTCCNGTAIESSTKLQNTIYFKSLDNSSIYVNLFVPSTVQWVERNVTIIQETNFPAEDNTTLTIEGNGNFDVYIRVPAWAKKGFLVTINGKNYAHKAVAGSYLKINRTWQKGDKVKINMPFDFHLEPVMDQQNIASLFYGPVLLAAQEPAARKDWRKISLNAKDPAKTISGDPRNLRFILGNVEFKPFYDTYGRHSVYLDVSLK